MFVGRYSSTCYYSTLGRGGSPETGCLGNYDPLWKNDLSGNWIINDPRSNGATYRDGEENFGKGRAAAEERVADVNYFNFLTKTTKPITPATIQSASILPESLPTGVDINKAETQ